MKVHCFGFSVTYLNLNVSQSVLLLLTSIDDCNPYFTPVPVTLFNDPHCCFMALKRLGEPLEVA